MKQYRIFLLKYFLKAVLLISLLFASESFSQNLFTIEGKITDAKTNEPLAYVNVSLSQTTIGAATDLNGIYKIGKIPRGNYALVASMVGYESRVTMVDLTNNHKTILNMSLERSAYEFNQIVVQGEIPTKWFDQLEIFKKQLFGKNDFAKKCIIKNPYQIDFKEDGSQLKATAREPIIIQNNALGYRIECVLKEFIYDSGKRASAYNIYPLFTELIPATADSAEEYQTNRKNAYLGSLAHLLTSLAVNNYKFIDEGFTIYTFKFNNNVFERLSPRKYAVRRASDIVRADSITNQYYLMANNSLLITYWNSGKHTLSRITLVTGITEFDPSGFLLFPDEFNIIGTMASEAVATMLPRYWKPPEEKE